MQSLFEWDFNGKAGKIEDIASAHSAEHSLVGEQAEFVQKLALGVVQNLPEIDEIIQKHAPEWPIDQTPMVDRNVLRLGVFELCFLKEVPPKVVIDEAVELGKSFGGESSGKFVNGVLGSVYKETQEPA